VVRAAIASCTTICCIKAQIGYKRRPGSYGRKPSLAVDNTLDRQFDVAAPDRAWMTDITYIRTLEGFAYLAGVTIRRIGHLRGRPTCEGGGKNGSSSAHSPSVKSLGKARSARATAPEWCPPEVFAKTPESTI
jgi:hypothetical protein